MLPQRWQALAHLVGARFREFMREPEVIFWVYGFPLGLALGLGFAFRSTEPPPPDVDVHEMAQAQEVADLLSQERWPDANLKVKVFPQSECERRYRTGQSALHLAVHPTKIEFFYDPSRSESVQARYWAEAILSRRETEKTVEMKTVPVSERGSRYVDFLFPGLIGINVMGGGLFGVGFVLVDMRVRKLFKRLMATPMRHSDFLLSLLISRLLFLIPEMASLLLVGVYLFGVPVYGSFFSVIVIILTGSAAFSGIGLLLGSRTEKTETISGLMNMIMLPMYVFSGVFFSSKRFPEEVQPLIQALPLTQMIDALREVMLEEKSFMDVAWRIGILAAYAIVCFTLALRWFKWR